MKPSFMVLNHRTGYTAYQHQSYAQALAEANRLAKKHIGDKYLILAVMSEVYVPPMGVMTDHVDMESREFKEAIEIPF